MPIPSETMRIVIAGVPRSGKTTLAKDQIKDWTDKDNIGVPLYHSDKFVGIDWSEQSRLAAAWLDEPGPWICEGVTMVRAVRKWMKDNDEKPCDVFIFIDRPSRSKLRPGQEALSKSCVVIYNGIRAELLTRGVEVKEYGPTG